MGSVSSNEEGKRFNNQRGSTVSYRGRGGTVDCECGVVEEEEASGEASGG
jgi:hypothetical protein